MLRNPGTVHGPTITSRVSLFPFLGYCLLVISAILALRALTLVFRPNRP